MFCWVRLPAGSDSAALLQRALDRDVAYVPGAPFYAAGGAAGTLRLSFVTASAGQIEAGIAALGALFAEQLEPVR
jgi:2-aminoadipate transaminase